MEGHNISEAVQPLCEFFRAQGLGEDLDRLAHLVESGEIQNHRPEAQKIYIRIRDCFEEIVWGESLDDPLELPTELLAEVLRIRLFVLGGRFTPENDFEERAQMWVDFFQSNPQDLYRLIVISPERFGDIDLPMGVLAGMMSAAAFMEEESHPEVKGANARMSEPRQRCMEAIRPILDSVPIPDSVSLPDDPLAGLED